MKQTLELQRKELNECRAEITSLKMHIEGARASRNWAAGEIENVQLFQIDNNADDLKSLNMETENIKGMNSSSENLESIISLSEDTLPMEKAVEMNEEIALSNSIEPVSGSSEGNVVNQPLEQEGIDHSIMPANQLINSCNGNVESKGNALDHLFKPSLEDVSVIHKSDSPKHVMTSEKMVRLVSMHVFF